MNPDALTTQGVKRGVQKKESVGKRITPVLKAGNTPIGFKIDSAKQNFINQTRGGVGGSMKGVGGKMDSLDEGFDDGDASGGGHHDDGHNGHNGHDGDHHDDHHDDHGHHDGHDDHHDIHIDINFYTHHSSPNGWWYMYGDYNGDGYTDYVCTNGYNSVYWYGWSGYYWGASPWYGWYGNRYGSSFRYTWWWNSVPDRYRGAVYGSNGDLSTEPGYSSMPTDQQAMPDAIPLSAVEVARLEMSIGEPGVAIDAYRAHLSEYPNDWRAVRELGLAMFRLGDRGDGIAMVSYAYSMDPELAYDAVPASLFEDSSRLIRDAVIDAVGWGHRNPSASAWLTVAVLMQAEGRDGPGLRMIERAREFGLDPVVDLAMESALSHR